MRILHLSDLHLPRIHGETATAPDARSVLAHVLHDCRRLTDVDVVLISGDITDDGSLEGYADALAMVGAFAEDRGAHHVWCVGNHDARGPFSEVLGTGHRDAAGRDVGNPAVPAHPACAAVSVVDGVRLITLDSLVPGEVAGRLSEIQLDWLERLLARSTPGGSVIALHHPPISVSPEWRAASLQEESALAGIVRGTDVHAILCGHVHAQTAGTLGGVPVWAGPGVITRIDLTSPRGIVRAVRGAAATVVELGGPYSPLFHVLHARDPRAGQQVYLADINTWQYVDEEDPGEQDTAPSARRS